VRRAELRHPDPARTAAWVAAAAGVPRLGRSADAPGQVASAERPRRLLRRLRPRLSLVRHARWRGGLSQAAILDAGATLGIRPADRSGALRVPTRRAATWAGRPTAGPLSRACGEGRPPGLLRGAGSHPGPSAASRHAGWQGTEGGPNFHARLAGPHRTARHLRHSRARTAAPNSAELLHFRFEAAG